MAFYARSEEARQRHSVHKLALVSLLIPFNSFALFCSSCSHKTSLKTLDSSRLYSKWGVAGSTCSRRCTFQRVTNSERNRSSICFFWWHWQRLPSGFGTFIPSQRNTERRHRYITAIESEGKLLLFFYCNCRGWLVLFLYLFICIFSQYRCAVLLWTLILILQFRIEKVVVCRDVN